MKHNSTLAKVVVAATLAAFAALPASVQAAPIFPPAPPKPTGVCDTAACILVCHVPQHYGRHWMYVQGDHLAQWLAEHPNDYVYRARINEDECAASHVWIMVGW